MSHTNGRTTHPVNTPAEAGFSALAQLALSDPDVVAALADRANWLIISNRDGSLRHVVPTTELTRA